MGSLIKLKINHKTDTGKDIPWDLIYLIKKDEIALSKRLFKYHLVVSKDETVKKFLKNVEFESLQAHGMERGAMFEETFSPKQTLDGMISLTDYSLLIPILTRGKKKGKKSLKYFTSKRFRKAAKDNLQYLNRPYGTSQKTAKPLEVPAVIISAGKDLEGYPCTNCENMTAKILDERACALGSAECLTNIIIGKGSDFSTAMELPPKESLKKGDL